MTIRWVIYGNAAIGCTLPDSCVAHFKGLLTFGGYIYWCGCPVDCARECAHGCTLPDSRVAHINDTSGAWRIQLTGAAALCATCGLLYQPDLRRVIQSKHHRLIGGTCALLGWHDERNFFCDTEYGREIGRRHTASNARKPFTDKGFSHIVRSRKQFEKSC